MSSPVEVPSGSGPDGGGPGGDDGDGAGGIGYGKGTSPTSWQLKVSGDGTGKNMQIQADGHHSRIHHTLSFPLPHEISISSHISIDPVGDIEEAVASMQVEFTDGDGGPGGGASVTMALATDGASTVPTWLDGVEVKVITWRD